MALSKEASTLGHNLLTNAQIKSIKHKYSLTQLRALLLNAEMLTMVPGKGTEVPLLTLGVHAASIMTHFGKKH